MKATALKKYYSVIMTLMQTIVILFLAFVITIVQCDFQIKDFDWFRFAMNFCFSTYMKTIYTIYAKNKEMLSDNIVILKNTITHDRTEIYNAQKIKEFELEIEKLNKINKLETYISYLDNKKKTKKNHNRIKEQRKWAYEYKKALQMNENIEEYEKEKSIRSIKIHYEEIKSSKLFTYGMNNSKNGSKKYEFDIFSSSINRAVIPTTISLISSILFGMISNNTDLKTGQLWIDLAGYLFSIVLGAAWGYTNGKAIIQEEYAEVLNNVSGLVREIKIKILGTRNENIQR